MWKDNAAQFYGQISIVCFLTDSDMSSVKVITLGVFDSAIKWRSHCHESSLPSDSLILPIKSTKYSLVPYFRKRGAHLLLTGTILYS